MSQHREARLDERELAVLAAVAREGAGRAGRGLSGLLGREVRIHVPGIRLGAPAEACTALGGPDAPVAGASLAVDGEAGVHVLLLFPLARALECVDRMWGRTPGTTAAMDELSASTLAELGNIVGSAFINALGDRGGVVLRPHPPRCVEGAALALVEAVPGGGDVVLIETVFEDERGRAAGLLMVAPGRSSLEHLLRRAA